VGAVSAVTHWGFRYRAHNGVRRWAVVVLPSEFGPSNPPPPLPLVISPHGRGVRAQTNARLWRELPARGPFAVICPGGMGRRLPLHSWGWQGQIDDLARMPAILREARPWLRIDPERIYAVGGSMGGQETLLHLARTRPLQALARLEVGGTPSTNPRAYLLRSPMNWIGEIAQSGVPLQVWWSDADEIVVDQSTQSGRFFTELRARGPRGRLERVTGSWSHTAQSYSQLQLPGAVTWLGLEGL
jgi:hypothetical protein